MRESKERQREIKRIAEFIQDHKKGDDGFCERIKFRESSSSRNNFTHGYSRNSRLLGKCVGNSLQISDDFVHFRFDRDFVVAPDVGGDALPV